MHPQRLVDRGADPARGLSEENGSWNTRLIRLRSAFSADPRTPKTSDVPNVAVPASGLTRPVSAAATVDFPDPDSPTRPSVVPRRI